MAESMTPRDDERRKFEAQAKGWSKSVFSSWNDHCQLYEHQLLNAEWRGWLARAEQAETPSTPEATDKGECMTNSNSNWPIGKPNALTTREQVANLGTRLETRASARNDINAEAYWHALAEESITYVFGILKWSPKPSQQAETPRAAELANVLVGCANLLDTIKGEWGESWSEWDQSMRDGITEYLKVIYARRDVRAVSQLQTFEEWWQKDGKFFDPDTDDVPWFDKRKELAEYAFSRARQITEAAAPVEDRPAPTPEPIRRQWHNKGDE